MPGDSVKQTLATHRLSSLYVHGSYQHQKDDTLTACPPSQYFPVLFFNYFILCVWVFCLRVCLCTMCVPGAHESQKRALYPLVPELQTVVSYCVGAGT